MADFSARVFLLICVLLCVSLIAAENIRVKEKEVLTKILKDYDVRIRPAGVNATGDADPVIVTLNTLVRSISKVDDINMEYHLQLTFRQSWTDPRFKFDDAGGKLKYLTLNDASEIWTPDVFFSNENEGSVHDLMKPNIYVRIFPDGRVLYSSRISLNLKCPMNLVKYPFDNQICSLRMASYGYTMDDVIFLWKEADPVQIVNNLHVPNFDLEKFMTDSCNSKTNTGEYSCLKVDFMFKRNCSFYLLKMFIPSVMLVMTSWVAFWLDHRDIAARVILGVTTLVTMTLYTITFESPKVNYNTALNSWTGVCITFIFFSLLETATVNYFPRWSCLQNRKKEEQRDMENGDNMDMPLMTPQQQQQQATGEAATPASNNTQPPKLRLQQHANRFVRCFNNIPTWSEKLDVVARVLFPIAFVVFVFLYLAIDY